MRELSAACDFEGTEFLLHAGGEAEGASYQRTQRQCAQDAGSVQSLAWGRLRLLLRQAVSPGEENQKRREEFPDRTSLDDQPLIDE